MRRGCRGDLVPKRVSDQGDLAYLSWAAMEGRTPPGHGNGGQHLCIWDWARTAGGCNLQRAHEGKVVALPFGLLMSMIMIDSSMTVVLGAGT